LVWLRIDTGGTFEFHKILGNYPVGFYTPEGGLLHSHYRESLKSYIALTGLGSVEET
jgi:hypothetical protein